MNDEDVIRKTISEKVIELYNFREENKEFVPGKTKVNYAGRVFNEKEIIAAVDSVLDFWITLGKRGQEFVRSFKEYMRMGYGLVTNSGSSANLIAVSALCSSNLKNPMKKGDEVITTATTFPTTLNPIIQNGLIPTFIDIEADTYNIDAGKIENAISDNTRAIMFAHTLGNPAEIDKIMNLAKRYNLFVIEDTCDALDSKYNGKLCGSYGDVSTYSFYAAHHITMGEGGAVLTDSPDIYREALSIRDWGRACFCNTGETNPSGACGHRFDYLFDGLPVGYDHKYIYSNIGYNLKPLDIQCAIGIEQLKKLPLFTEKRKENFKILFNAFKKYEDYFILPRVLPTAEPSWFSFPLTVRKDAGFNREDIIRFLESNMIETRMLFAGNILKHPAYKGINYHISGDLNNSNQILESSFFLGVYPGMTQEKNDYLIKIINDFMFMR